MIARFHFSPSRCTTLAVLLATAVLGSAPVSAQCTASEIKKLLASDGFDQDNLGLSIDVDGDTAVIGTWLNDNVNGADAGAAYIFQRDSGGVNNWGEVKKLIASNGQASDAFGWSVSISGSIAVVGAYRVDDIGVNRGSAYLFGRNVGGVDNWGELKILTASNAADNDQFGYSVAVSGTSVAVGAQLSDALGLNSGSAYIFDKDNGGVGNWGEVTEITAVTGAAGYSFGRSISLDADTVLVGAYLDDALASGAGAAYVFDRDNGGLNAWGQTRRVTASDGAADDTFGSAVSISGVVACVGAPLHDLTLTETEAGAAYVFVRNFGGANNWGEISKLVGSATSKNDNFGAAVGADGLSVIVGSFSDTARGNNAGVAYVFGKDWGGTNNWGQSHKLTASDPALQDRFAWSVGISGATVVAGATHDDANGANAGAGYVFDLASGSVAYCTAGTSANGCQALISSTGTPSATAPTGFTLDITGLEGQKDGLYFFGTNGRQANSWGSGTSFQCVTPPVKRTGLQLGNGTVGLCDAVFSQDLNARWTAKPAQNPGAGALVQAQAWYRDPANTSNQTTSLSDALEFTVCP